MNRLLPIIMMLFVIPFLATVAVSQYAYADQLEVSSKLSDEQKAQLALTAAQLAHEHDTSSATAVKQWVDIGTAIGSGLASSAKELGIAANEFANTPVGKFTIVIIAWHFMGSEVVHIGFGLLWLITLLPVWVYLYRRTWFTTKIETFETGKGPDGKTKVVTKTVNSDRDVSDSVSGLLWVSLIVILAVGVISTFTY